ncbi:MAG TPA: efflux RND transporter permease subunit, partial [Phenylobacterium sp.]|nr:efflux RND transporter permease subunit [Phenylobacterium sp.]
EAGLPPRALAVFERVLRSALRRPWIALALCAAIGVGGLGLFTVLKSDFMPAMDEGGFIIDYLTPWGTSLQESDRMMRQAEAILQATPEVEGYSRRTGARLALAIAEPNKGDFLVKLKPDRKRSTETVKRELRERLNAALPSVEWEFPGILSDLLGDLTDSPDPIQVKLFSNDTPWLMNKAAEVKAKIAKVKGVVDLNDGLVMTGPSLTFRVRQEEARRIGLSANDIATALNTALLGRTATSVLEGDRVVFIRVMLERQAVTRATALKDLPLRTAAGQVIKLSQVADLVEEPGQLELRREDLRQMVAVTGALEGRDLGSGLAEIKKVLAADPSLPSGSVEIGGLFQQQQESFRNLLIVLALSISLVFGVLVIEFRSFREPTAIVGGAVLALVGTAVGLWVTDTTLNIVSMLGAIIGVGIVAKNGILMLDQVGQHLGRGEALDDALVHAGRRRLRPILMTTLATILAMLPLAWGIGHGADMLRPLAIGLIGALCVSILLSLVATPTFYFLLQPRLRRDLAGARP